MGCMTYIDERTEKAVHTCQMCEQPPEVGQEFVVDGVSYIVTKVIPEITNNKKSLKVYVR